MSQDVEPTTPPGPASPGRELPPGGFVRAGSLSLTGNVITFGLAIVGSVILARGLGVDGRGIYGTAVMIPTMLVTLGEFGVGFASIYLLAQARFGAAAVAGNNLVIGSVLGALVVAIGAIAVLLAGSPFSGVPDATLLLAIAAFPPLLIATIQTRLFIGLQNYLAYAISNVLLAGSIVAAAVVTVLLLGADAEGAVAGYACACAVACGAILIWVRKNVGKFQLRAAPGYWRAALTFGTLNQIGQVMAFLNYRIDVFMIAAIQDARAVGLYLAAVALAEPLWLVSQAAAPVVFGRAAGIQNDGTARESTFAVARLMMIMSGAAALVIGLAATPVLTLLFSSAFAPAASALQLLLPGVVARSGSRILSSDLAGSGRPGVNAQLGSATLVVNVLLNAIWIPSFGIEGAALASSVSYSLSLLLRLIAYQRIYDVAAFRSITPRPSDLRLLLDLLLGATGRGVRGSA